MNTKEFILYDLLTDFAGWTATEAMAEVEAIYTCTCCDECCYACSVRDCPHHAIEHYWNDGCPMCMHDWMDTD